MNIYKCSQNDNTGYDTFDAFVCYAKDETEAKNMLPEPTWSSWSKEREGKYTTGEWAFGPDSVKVEFIGMAPEQLEAGVILASFNAG